MSILPPNHKASVGFTGTQRGMTAQQKYVFSSLMTSELAAIGMDPGQFHHGDCIGADAEAHDIVHKLGMDIYIHPPYVEEKRAFCTDAFKTYEPKPYLERDHDIVDASDILIATPKLDTEELRSGTWATVRYARRLGRPIIIIYPNGETTGEKIHLLLKGTEG